MPNRIEDDFGEAARHLRVDTLVMLRWSAIIGQTFALIYVYHYLKFDFPIGLCFVAVATSTALNIALRAGTPRSFRLDDSEAERQLFTARSLDASLAATATLAADDVLLDDLLTQLSPAAQRLLLGVSVYRQPVDRNAALYQIGEPDDAAAHGDEVVLARRLLGDQRAPDALRRGQRLVLLPGRDLD